jgi:hypothetical protein
MEEGPPIIKKIVRKISFFGSKLILSKERAEIKFTQGFQNSGL